MQLAFALSGICMWQSPALAGDTETLTAPAIPNRRQQEERKLATMQEALKEMTAAGLKLYEELRSPHRHQEIGRASRVFETYWQHSERIWSMVDDALELTHGMYPLRPLEQDHLFQFVRWYSSNATTIFSVLNLNFEQTERLLHRFFLRFDVLRKNILTKETKELLFESYHGVYLSFQYLLAKKFRIDVVNMIMRKVEATPDDVERGLSITSDLYWSRGEIGMQNVPYGYEWLVGLSELVMDGKMYAEITPNLPSDEATEKLFSAYLHMYEAVLQNVAMKADDATVPKFWIERLVLVPVAHIASLNTHYPQAATEAKTLLQKTLNGSESNQIKARLLRLFNDSELNPNSKLNPNRKQNPLARLTNRCRTLITQLSNLPVFSWKKHP